MPNAENQLLDLLKSIEGNGSFVTKGVNKFTPPGLRIEGIGDIGFPLNPIQIKAIIKQARQAPFGKGNQTITDTAVRKVWEIDASQLSFLHKDWNKFLQKTLKSVKKGLGLGKVSVKASLYKLLIYEEGSFFLSHQDSEKEAGMFATLVVGLPAIHTGGALVIRFDGREEVIDFASSTSNFTIPHAAFFADCEHEIRPVTSGYRVCLVYNLLQTASSRKITSPQFSTQVDQLSSLLQSMTPSLGDRPKVILLGHQYTSANFSLEQLKHHDRPRAEALIAAAEKAQYFARLGLLTCYQMGQLEGADHYYDYRNRYSNHYDEPEPGYMGEIYEEYIRIQHWDQNLPGLGDLYVPEEEIIADIKITEGEPVEQEEEGFTGNAGMTLQYWYHYGALILWPKSKHHDLLQNISTNVKLQWLDFYLKHWNAPELSSQTYVKYLLTTFVIGQDRSRYNPTDYSAIASAFIRLQDKTILKKHGKQLLHPLFEKIKVKPWMALLHQYPPKYFTKIFAKAAATKELRVIHHLLKILKKLRSSDQKRVNTFFHQQVQLLPHYLKELKLCKLDQLTAYQKYEEENRNKTTASILKSLLILSQYMEKDKSWIKAILACLTQDATRTYTNAILVPILLSRKYENRTLAKKLASISKKKLKARKAVKPVPPADWVRAVPKSKYYQDVWQILEPFLHSPTQEIFDYQKNQSFRSAMESAIRNVDIDLKMETIKKGSPHTLRLTKTQRAYEKALTEWKEDVALLQLLNHL